MCHMCMISIVYFTGYIFFLLQSLFKSMLLKFWRSYEAMFVNKMWQTSVLLVFIWYVLVCTCMCVLLFLLGQECTSRQERKIPLWHALMVWSQLSQCHLFLVCLLKMTLILGTIWTCLFRGSFTASFIWELEVYFQEMEGFLWRELGVYVLKFWKVLCIFWSFV